MHAPISPPPRSTASLWAARISTLAVAAFALLETQAVRAQDTFSVGTNLVNISKTKGNETDPSIAINSANPSNIVMVAATDKTVPGLFLAVTTNTGGSWQTNVLATNNDAQGLTPAYGEPSVAFDSHGNLFLAYLPETFEGVAVAVSTNGGKTFASLTNLAALDVTDQPRLTAPPSGAAAGSVWVVYKDYTTANSPLQVQGLLSTGLGAVGTFGVAQIVPASADGGFADIAVGPLGQVMVAFQDNLEGLPNPVAKPPANIWVSLQTNAIANVNNTNNGFATAQIVATNAVGGVCYIPAAPTGIGVNAAPGLAWDYNIHGPNYGNAYLIYNSVGANGNLLISFISSRDGGADWSDQTFVDDDATNASNDHFLPRLAVDPVSGLIGCSWYDCRNDLGSASQAITNVIQDSFTFTNLSVTNVTITANVAFLSTNWTDLTGQGTDILVTIAADDVGGTMMTADKTGGITIGGKSSKSFLILDEGYSGTNAPGTNAMVTVILTNIFPLAYTSGSAANQEAIMYATLSFDGGKTFLPNQQLSPPNAAISAPAVGIASDAAGSRSLTGWGHYTGLAAYGASFFPVWADNSDVTTNNPDGANAGFDIYMLSTAGGQTISAPTADLSIWVTNFSTNVVISQELISYSIIVTNHGPKAAGPVIVTNVLSPSVTLVPNGVIPALGGAYSIGLSSNGQQQVVFTWLKVADLAVLTNTIRVAATTSSLATNFASIYSPFIDLVPTNNSNQLVLLIDGEDLAMGMATSETNALLGDTVLTCITVTNLGPATNGPVFITNSFSTNWSNITIQAQGTNLVTNTPSGPVAIVNLGLLPVGQPVTATFMAVASSGGAFASQSATVSSQDYDTNMLDNSAAFSYFFNDEDLAIGMTPSNTNVDLGELINYNINVTNFGPSYSGSVTVNCAFSPNLQPVSATQSQGAYTIAGNQLFLNLGPLGAGQIASMTVSALAVSGPPLATNIVTVSSAYFDTNTANNTAEAIVTITPPLLIITNLLVIPMASSAFIVWDTGSPATDQVLYGTTSNYDGFSPLSARATTHHAVLLTGLAPGIDYSFETLSWVGSHLLVTNGSFILTNALILNTQDAKYTGLWTAASVATGIYGSYYQFSTTTVFNATSWALYDPFIPASGLYNVYIWHPQSATFTTNAQVYVTGPTNELVLSVNESIHGGSWQPLATNFYFARGTNGHVLLYNDTGDANKYLVANAMMWVYNPAQDSPANGVVPAWWANFYFGTNFNGSIDGAADPDGDGYSNYAEYVFGTDPTDALSHLTFTVAPALSNAVSVTFSPCQGGRAYTLLAATNLANPLWTALTNTFTPGTNGSGTFIVTQTNSAAAFYRLSAQITP